ncbi:tumor necrosis factor receptor superfamily member 6B-like [Solea solea]|uniref:tumor necrosis factor receptor superfamily member 6B-like n=1 Tax=Solea solea TaxID=90069 RepID=UPI002729EA3A|nr:tumor necrosis factor receptor superfamily member 6B-like [Solea solea]
MYIISMLFLPVQLLLLSGVLCGATAEDPVNTFLFTNPRTGEKLTCDKCPPGTYMRAPCTSSAKTQCNPCTSQHFTELWNYLPRCLYCNNFCTDNQEVETECSAVHNRVCRCKEGFYWAEDFCVRHSKCEPGYGVTAKGTPQSDTVCEMCSEGYFSSSSPSLKTCVKHQECTDGKIALLHGSLQRDTVCGTCEELASGGETLRTFLSGLLTTHRMRMAKMKTFVTKYINKSVPRQRGPLQQEIRAWLARAPEDQLRKLPQMLKASQLSCMADNLETRLMEIKQQSPGCSLSL